VAAAVILLVGIAAVYAYNRITSFDVERVTDDVHVIYNGIAGNVGVLGTETGAVVVDTMTFRLQGRQLRELAEKLGGGPTQAIINTHYHRDHTHGNPAFAVGARFVATQRTRDYLMYLDAEYWQGAAEGTLPNETFEREHEMRVGGKTTTWGLATPAATWWSSSWRTACSTQAISSSTASIPSST
jgi:glyoxylase-like metal-dependent hydrolase (beta-lactamase superfamily II)